MNLNQESLGKVIITSKILFLFQILSQWIAEKVVADFRMGENDISLLLILTGRKIDLKTENKRLFVGKKCLKEVKRA